MRKVDLRKLNTKIAYPWPVEVTVIDNVSGLSTDEQIYPTPLVGAFVLGRDKLGGDS